MAYPAIATVTTSVFFLGLPPIPKGQRLYADGLQSFVATKEETYSKTVSDSRFVNVSGDDSTGQQFITKGDPITDTAPKWWGIKYTHANAPIGTSGFRWFDYVNNAEVGAVERYGSGTDSTVALRLYYPTDDITSTLLIKADGTFRHYLDGAQYVTPTDNGDIMIKKFSIVKGANNNIIGGTYTWYEGKMFFKDENGDPVFSIGYDADGHNFNFHSQEITGVRDAVGNDEPVNKGQMDDSITTLSTTLTAEIEKAKILGMFF